MFQSLDVFKHVGKLRQFQEKWLFGKWTYFEDESDKLNFYFPLKLFIHSRGCIMQTLTELFENYNPFKTSPIGRV